MSKNLYGIVSDVHAHNYSTMSKLTKDGLNSRLVATLDELKRAADEIVAAKGGLLVMAGDLFHARGSLDPEVFNQVHQTFEEILDKHRDLSIAMIPGNHDLKSDDTKELSNAFATFEALERDKQRITVLHEKDLYQLDDYQLAFVPWRHKRDDLLLDIQRIADHLGARVGEVDLIIHAGIDGVLSGMPDHGLTAAMLEAFGFKRVFAGHYHNHKAVTEKVYSIGALTHQTWGDIGTRAGFLLVDDTTVNFRASHAPSFVDASGLSEEEMSLVADGNFVRYRGDELKDEHVKALRKFFEDHGAKGVTIEGTRAKASARGTAVAAKGVTIEESVASFVDNGFKTLAPERVAKIKKAAADVMAEVRSFEVA